MQASPSFQLPEVFTSAFGLGAPTGYFPVGKSSRWGGLIATIIFLGGGGLLGLFGLFYAYSQSQQYGPAVFMNHLIPFIIFSGIAIVIGLISAWSTYTNWNKAVVLYTNGLAYNDNKGLQTWRWDEVDQFFFSITKHYTNGVYTGTTYLYTIRKQDGSKLAFDNKFGKNEIQQLGSSIEKSVVPFQYKRAADTYNTGQVVNFGPISISKAGITIGKKTYPWQEVEKITLNGGMLKVAKKGGGWFSGAAATVSTVPNLTALLSIIDQVVGINTK